MLFLLNLFLKIVAWNSLVFLFFSSCKDKEEKFCVTIFNLSTVYIPNKGDSMLFFTLVGSGTAHLPPLDPISYSIYHWHS